MRIAAIFIPKGELEHIFGKNHEAITINLGGEYLYTLEETAKRVKIKKKVVNKKFVKDFWHDKIECISAIVGENGSGKTTLFNLFRDANYNPCYVIETGSTCKIAGSDDFDVIYYSGFLSSSKVGRENENFWDVSKNAFMVKDCSDDQSSIEGLLEIHEGESLKRWIAFMNFRNSKEQLKILPLAAIEKIKIKVNIFSEPHYQTSGNFRPFFDKLNSMLDKELNTQVDAIYKTMERPDLASKATYQVRLENTIIKALVGKIHKILERTGNGYLEEGFIENGMTVRSPEFTSLPNAQAGFRWFLEKAYIQLRAEAPKIRFPVDQILKLQQLLLDSIEGKIEDWTEFYVDFSTAEKIISCYNEFILAFKKDFFYDRSILLSTSTDKNLSSGEKALYDHFAALYDQERSFINKTHYDTSFYHKRSTVKKNIILLIDEGDLGFHPEWKIAYVDFIQRTVPLIFRGKKIQIIFATHDPLTLSDIPNSNIVYLKKRNEFTAVLGIDHPERPKKTFGANISDLLTDSFFLTKGLIGDFAKEKIRSTIAWINHHQSLKHREKPTFQDELVYHKSIISLIDEHVIREKLSEMIAEVDDSNAFQIEMIDREIDYLTKKKAGLSELH